jgi:prepilin-type N-terminal cleavage/methylation domain-containing protein
MTARGREGGFTLMEVLVASIIVGLTLGVLFQVMSSGAKLRLASRDALDTTLAARQIFDGITVEEMSSPDFAWSGEDLGGKWELTLEPIEIPADQLEHGGLPVRLTSALYEVTFRYLRGGSTSSLARLVALPTDRIDFESPFSLGGAFNAVSEVVIPLDAPGFPALANRAPSKARRS